MHERVASRMQPPLHPLTLAVQRCSPPSLEASYVLATRPPALPARRYGRRRLLLSSIAGVLVALTGLGAAFYAGEQNSPPLQPPGNTCQGVALPDCTACLRHGYVLRLAGALQALPACLLAS